MYHGLRDRRTAASDQYLAGGEVPGDEAREAALWERNGRVNRAGRDGHRTQPWTGRWIYGAGSSARPTSLRPGPRFDATSLAPDRAADRIRTVILHSTWEPVFSGSDLPPESEDEVASLHHGVDQIICHLQVLSDGTVVYTHDLGFILNDAGGRLGVDIEFHGHFATRRGGPRAADASARLRPEAIRAGRALLKSLRARLPSLEFIHPHGQVQGEGERPDKFHSCPGADVWVNVGMWAVRHLGLKCGASETGVPNRETDGSRPNRGISRLQLNRSYEQIA